MSSKRTLGKESGSQYQVHNLLGPVKSENMGPFAQNLRTSKLYPQIIKISTLTSENCPPEHGAPQTSMKLVLVRGSKEVVRFPGLSWRKWTLKWTPKSYVLRFTEREVLSQRGPLGKPQRADEAGKKLVFAD